MDSPLTPGERKSLAQLEKTIDRGMKSFMDVGRSLLQIKEEKLYTDVADTFEAYCSVKWDRTRTWAYQLIDSAKAAEAVSTIVDILPPTGEAQARELAKVEGEEKQATVWAKAVETAPKGKDGRPKVTAAHVAKVAKEVAAPIESDDLAEVKSEPDPDIEAIGAPYVRAVNDLNRIRREFVELAKQERTGAYLNLVVGRITKGVDDAKSPISQNQPVAVCGGCAGGGCDGCSRTGFVTKGIEQGRGVGGATT